MEVLKKILNIIIDIFIILVVIISAVIAVVSITARDSGVSNLFGYVPFTVQSNSMSPVFEAGDLIVGKYIPDEEIKTFNFQKGDIITFWDAMEQEDGEQVQFLNTHRIVSVETHANGYTAIETKGDHNKVNDKGTISSLNVVAIWSSADADDGIRIQKLGSVLDFLKQPTGFFMAVLLPMAIFFIYELVRFITNFMNYNKEKAKEAALEAAKELMGDDSSDNSGLSEEQKAQAILEFLERQKAEKGDTSQDPKSEPTPQTAVEETEESAEQAPEQTPFEPETVTEAAVEEAVEEETVAVEAEAEPAEEAAQVLSEPEVPVEETPVQIEETEQPAAEVTEAVTAPEQEEAVSEISED